MTSALVFGYGIAYALGAFVAWEVNPSVWGMAARIWVAFMGLAFTGIWLIGRVAK